MKRKVTKDSIILVLVDDKGFGIGVDFKNLCESKQFLEFYRGVLKKGLGAIELKEKVVLFVNRKRGYRQNAESVAETLEKAREFCEEQNVEELYVPLESLYFNGYSIDMGLAILERVFKGSKVRVVC